MKIWKIKDASSQVEKPMTAACAYSSQQFKKAHRSAHQKAEIYKAFEVLEIEIQKLDELTQIHLYAAASDLLRSMIEHPKDSINPLEIFALRCNSILKEKQSLAATLALAIGVIVLSVAVTLTGVAAGLGIGMMLGLWATPMVFFEALLAVNTLPVVIAATSTVAGISSGIAAGLLLFKGSSAQQAVEHCIEEIKKSYLSPDTDIVEDVIPETEGVSVECN